MERLIEILENINPEVDYNKCETLIDDHYLDSLSILSIVADIEDEFDVVIPTVEIIPSNFNSAKKLFELIEKLEEDN